VKSVEKEKSSGSWIDELDGILEEMEREDREREGMMLGGRHEEAEQKIEESVEGSDQVESISGEIEDPIEASKGSGTLSPEVAGATGVEDGHSTELLKNGQPKLPFLEDGNPDTGIPTLSVTSHLSCINEVDMMIPERYVH